MLRTIVLLAVFAFLVDFVVALNGEMQQLKKVLKVFDEDYKEGNMTRLASDFKSALKEYGDGQEGKSTFVQEFLKKMEVSGEQQGMKKLETEWKDYVTARGKQYNSSETRDRMTIFESNELMTEKMNREHDQGLRSYTTSLNSLADLTDEEFMMMNGLQLPNETDFHGRRTRQTDNFYKYSKADALPDSFDWRRNGFVTSVREQGGCGSCYAFATAAALEGYYKRRAGKLVDLSPQNIIDCTMGFGNRGCKGGLVHKVFEYAKSYGIAMESSYPYVEAVQGCKWQQNMGVARDNGYVRIKPGDEMGLKHAVIMHGPVVVGVCASADSFRFYKSGVYQEQCSKPNHAVLVVGYGIDRKYGEYWIVKNSWGTDWGQDGYVHTARNKGNMCQIASVAVFPI